MRAGVHLKVLHYLRCQVTAFPTPVHHLLPALWECVRAKYRITRNKAPSWSDGIDRRALYRSDRSLFGWVINPNLWIGWCYWTGKHLNTVQATRLQNSRVLFVFCFVFFSFAAFLLLWFFFSHQRAMQSLLNLEINWRKLVHERQKLFPLSAALDWEIRWHRTLHCGKLQLTHLVVCDAWSWEVFQSPKHNHHTKACCSWRAQP